MRQNVWLTVAYDGTTFHGFQRQANQETVQEYLEAALGHLYGHKVSLFGAARTDAGVHARGQEVCAYVHGTIPPERIPRAIVPYLPPQIVVLKACEMPDNFHVRRDNIGKHYRYTIHNGINADPFQLLYSWHIRKPLDVSAMVKVAQVLKGQHDFSAFQGKNTTPMNPLKTIYDIRIQRQRTKILIDVIGDGFLYHMVRNIAGALVDAGRGQYMPKAIQKILADKDRTKLGITAPARGLCLEKVFFTNSELAQELRYDIEVTAVKIP